MLYYIILNKIIYLKLVFSKNKMPSTITETSLQELLPEYYKRLFPHYLMCKWLGYSEGKIYIL